MFRAGLFYLHVGLEPFMAKDSIQARATQLTQAVLQQADAALYLADARYLSVSMSLGKTPCMIAYEAQYICEAAAQGQSILFQMGLKESYFKLVASSRSKCLLQGWSYFSRP